MKDVEGTVQFLTLLSAMAARLSDRGRSIFDVQYDGLSFGSWTLTGGTRKHRVRLQWDGKEGVLSVGTAVFADSRSRPRWNAFADRSPDVLSTQEILTLAENLILEHSAAGA
jgi:hypothetical protein